MKVLDRYPRLPDWFCDFREESGGVYCSSDCPLKNHRCARCRFWVGTDGRLMFGCPAGCNKLEILRAVGMKWADTFPAGADLKRLKQEVAARYAYRDESGALLYETLRLEPGRGGKDKEFRQRRPKVPVPRKREDWEWSLGDVRRVLYRLPDLVAADPDRPVIVVAGEKDADNLAALDLLATTNVCGEHAAWLDSYSETLAGRHVVVIEDRDGAGKRHASGVCGSLLDYAASVRRARLPAKDATAFLNGLRRDGVADRAALRADLLAVLAETRTWVGVG